MTRTTISWSQMSWNPTRGCSRVSEGCRNCYAEKVAHRFNGPGLPYEGLTRGGKWTGEVRLVPEKLADPLRWRLPRRVFVDSMSDLFHPSIPDDYIAAVFGVMAAAPRHTFQVLTKRPDRALEWFTRMALGAVGVQGIHGADADPWTECHWQALLRDDDRETIHCKSGAEEGRPWPLPNVWLGVSVEDQATADARIPLLLQCEAAVHWVSYEPGLGPVRFRGGCDYNWLDPVHTGTGPKPAALGFVVVGGESGPNARPCDVAWIRSTVQQCETASVACHVKQLGANVIDRNDAGWEGQEPWHWPDIGRRVEEDLDGTRDGYQGAPIRVRLEHPKGGNPLEWPQDLRVREWPR